MILSVDETRGIAFVDKPCGLLVHNSAWAGPREHTLVDEARALLGREWHPLHRLDRQTSGVVAFARADVVRAWSERMNDESRVDKRYWALVRGHVRSVVEIDHAIRDDSRDGEPTTTALSEPLGGAGDDERDGRSRPARSRVTPLLLSSVDRCSLVEVRLFTGRRHQARRHLKHISHPVIGDATHGKGAINRAFREAYGLGRMALHARSLSIDGAHATAKVPLDLVLPLRRLFGPAFDEMNDRHSD